MPLLTYFDTIDREDIEWLWPNRIALGKVTLLSGDAGLGKGLITIDIASRVSWGTKWPDGEELAPQGGVILFSAEDGINDTVAKRIDAAEGDDKFIAVMSTELDELPAPDINAYGEPVERLKPFSLETDIPRLEAAITEMNETGKTCRLVVIDPINEYTGRFDIHKNGELRSLLLRPLRSLPSRYHVAVIVVTPLNKNVAAPAQYRSGGSIAIAAAARSTLMVAEDPEDPNYRLLIGGKINVGVKAPGLRYSIAPSNGASDATARVYWDDKPVVLSMTELLTFNPSAGKELEEAKDWVREQLNAGEAPAADLNKNKPRTISARTFRRALKEAAVFVRSKV